MLAERIAGACVLVCWGCGTDCDYEDVPIDREPISNHEEAGPILAGKERKQLISPSRSDK